MNPITIMILIGIYGIYKKKTKLTFISFIFLYLLLTPFFPSAFLRSIENKYRDQFQGHKPKNIIVIGGGFNINKLPLTQQLPTSVSNRIVEAVMLKEKYPKANLILTAFEIESRIMKKYLNALGNKWNIYDDSKPNTMEQISFIKELNLKGKSFILTNASHMPRTIKLAKKEGLNLIPYPTDFIIRRDSFELKDLRPSPDAFHMTMTLWYELFGNIHDVLVY